MRFKLFGIPVEIQMSFWLIAVLLDIDTVLRGQHKFLILVWVAVVFLSIMVHELGHAIAMMRHGMRPEITFHMLGGLTSAHGIQRLTRPQRIFVSFAGPLAGFVLAGIVFAITLAVPSLVAPVPEAASKATLVIQTAVVQLLWVNFGWGIINLIPVLPLDGGHILEDLLGPKRTRITAILSLVAGASVTVFCLTTKQLWIAFIFGLATMQSFQRFRAAQAEPGRAKDKPRTPPEDAVDPAIVAQIREAEAALADDRYDEAGTIAELVLNEEPPKRVRMAALEILGWAHLLEDRPKEAGRIIKALERLGEPDLALVGAVMIAEGREEEARKVLERARSRGDDRKEVVGPLIQLLVKQNEVARAAAIALDIVDTLSEDDARQMASISFDHEAYAWSSRLSEAVFERSGEPDDAYEAARSRALDGDPTGALMLLRRAVAAGYSDAARVWSDKALEVLRSSEIASELEALLPRESPAD
ncbi:MAG: site-2 protease family protein [Deltaproteobacteria bacterium]|nr:site-2 protease family protein [Deltaproteobacteria bacterium]